MPTEQGVSQEQLLARLVFASHEFPVMIEAGQRHQPGQIAFTPASIEHVFHQVDMLLRLAHRAAQAEEERETSTGMFMTMSLGEGSVKRPAAPAEVRRIQLASPLEIIVALSGVYATPRTLRYLIDLVAEAFSLRARIRRDRAQLEAEELAAKVDALKSKRELVRLAADVLQSRTEHTLVIEQAAPQSMDLWLGDADDPPELASSGGPQG